MSEKKQKIRSIIRQWVIDEVNGSEFITIPALTEKGEAYFGAQRKFRDQFFDEQFHTSLYQIIRSVIGTGRETHVVVGDTIMSNDEVEERTDKMLSSWHSWFEYTGSRHVRLAEMTKPELLAAADIRRKAAKVQTDRAELLEALAEQLEDDERVGDKFDLDVDVTKIWLTIVGDESERMAAD